MRFSIVVLAIASTALGAAPKGASAQDQESRCRVAHTDNSAGTLGAICDGLRRRWIELIDSPPPPGEVVLTRRIGFLGTNDDRTWHLEYELPLGVVAPRLDDKRSTIAHEAGHRMFAVHISTLHQQWDGRRYGSLAPDWFDEAPAIWMESDSDRALRLALVRGSRPALASVLMMEHPQRALAARDGNTEFQILTQTVTPPCPPCTFLPDSLRSKYRVTRVRLFTSGRADTVTTYEASHPDGSTTFEEKQFYPLAYSLLLFIHTRGGSAAVRELIARYRADPSARTDVLNNLPGLASSFAQIERDWHQFLATETPSR